MTNTRTKPSLIAKLRRHKRVRATISGTALRPRLSISRSNTHVFVQLIDDEKKVTIASVNDKNCPEKKGTKVTRATWAGKEIATLGKSKGVTRVVFDRGGFLYHGRVKAVAEGARVGGLEF